MNSRYYWALCILVGVIGLTLTGCVSPLRANKDALRGQVLDNNGTPLAGVIVAVTRSGYINNEDGETEPVSEEVGTCTTDADGRFAIFVPVSYQQLTLKFTKSGLTGAPVFFKDSLDLPASELTVRMTGAPTLSNHQVTPSRVSQCENTPLRLSVLVADDDKVTDVKALFLNEAMAEVKTVTLSCPDGVPPQAFSAETLTARDLARGTYTVRFHAIDTDGNISNTVHTLCVVDL